MCSLKKEAEGAAAAPHAKFEKTITEPKPKRKSYERQRFRARGSDNVSLMCPFLGNGTNEQSESRNEQFFHKFNDELFIIF